MYNIHGAKSISGKVLQIVSNTTHANTTQSNFEVISITFLLKIDNIEWMKTVSPSMDSFD